MSNKSYKHLQKECLSELGFVTNIGKHLFAYPYIGKTGKTWYCYNFMRLLVLTTSCQLFISLCLTNFTDWFEIVNIAPNLGACLMVLIKFTKINNHGETYNSILEHFKTDLWEIIADREDHKTILATYMNTTFFILRFEYYYTIVLAVVVTLFPRLIMWYNTEVLGNEFQYLYPFDGWYPFDKVKWYYVAYAWESSMTIIVIFMFMFINMTQLSFTRCFCMELKTMGTLMESLINSQDVENIMKFWNVVETHCEIKKKLKVLARRHQFIVNKILELDNVLGDGMLLIYSFGSVFICLTIFTATVVDNFYMRIRYFSFFCSLLMEVFFQCIIGQLLIDHSLKLENAVYFADWPYADDETKKMLLIMLIRIQTPLKLTAKGYVIMNLDTFSSICSLSYQFFNLLRTALSDS